MGDVDLFNVHVALFQLQKKIREIKKLLEDGVEDVGVPEVLRVIRRGLMDHMWPQDAGQVMDRRVLFIYTTHNFMSPYQDLHKTL